MITNGFALKTVVAAPITAATALITGIFALITEKKALITGDSALKKVGKYWVLGFSIQLSVFSFLCCKGEKENGTLITLIFMISYDFI